MKGIVLAGGSGTRLHPLTLGVSKQLLPVFNKPMIYYPLSVLMMAGIRDILVISTPDDLPSYRRLLGSGEKFGVNFTYKCQERPDGLAQAFIIGSDFVGSESVCLVLGDNIFHGQGLTDLLLRARNRASGATIFAHQVADPGRFGVVLLDTDGSPLSIEEKPLMPKSNLAVTGLYFYDNKVLKIAETIRPSGRGELEISSINNVYIESRALHVETLGRGFAWLDTGTFESLQQASHFVDSIESRQGLMVACLEEIAFAHGWLDSEQLRRVGMELSNSSYGQYLIRLAEEST